MDYISITDTEIGDLVEDVFGNSLEVIEKKPLGGTLVKNINTGEEFTLYKLATVRKIY